MRTGASEEDVDAVLLLVMEAVKMALSKTALAAPTDLSNGAEPLDAKEEEEEDVLTILTVSVCGLNSTNFGRSQPINSDR